MSLCDHCFKPGACCKSFQLFEKDGAEITFWESGGKKAAQGYVDWNEWPFRPVELAGVWLDEESGRSYQSYRFSCDALDSRTGRCMRYEDRPQLCRDFTPASGMLCVHYLGAEGTGEGL